MKGCRGGLERVSIFIDTARRLPNALGAIADEDEEEKAGTGAAEVERGERRVERDS
jgi:hypothetical protein